MRKQIIMWFVLIATSCVPVVIFKSQIIDLWHYITLSSVNYAELENNLSQAQNGWVFTKFTDPMTDDVFYQGILASEDGEGQFFSITCTLGTRPLIDLHWRSTMDEFQQHKSRLDKLPAVEGGWNWSNEKTMVRPYDDLDYLNGLVGHYTLVVSATSKWDGELTASFNVSNTKAILKKLASNCRAKNT